MHHVESGKPFGMAVHFDQIALDDQARTVLHQSMADEAQHRPGAGRLPVEPGIRIGGRGMGGVRTPLAPEVDLSVRCWQVGRGIGLISA